MSHHVSHPGAHTHTHTLGKHTLNKTSEDNTECWTEGGQKDFKFSVSSLRLFLIKIISLAPIHQKKQLFFYLDKEAVGCLLKMAGRCHIFWIPFNMALVQI